MRTRYRVILERNSASGTWQPVGVVYERQFDAGKTHVLPMIDVGAQHVDWREWEAIDRRIAALYERYVLAPAREASESLVYPLPPGRAAATQIVRDRDAE